MSFPATLTTRTVKGRFVTVPDGQAAEGSVRIVLDDFMQGPTDDAFVVPFDITIPFDENGQVSIVLPSNNDPQWTPAIYRIILTVGNKTHREKFVVPYDGTGDLDLADILNIPAPTPGESYVLLASKGAAGGVASLGLDGKVPSSQLPVGSGGTSVSWLDLTDKPATFPPSAHAHPTSDVTGLVSALAAKADLVGGVLPTSQLPSIAVVDFLGSVSTQTAMLALTGQKGDWCIRTDVGQTFVITGSDPTQLASWTAMPIGVSPVQTVNGQTGTVVLGKADIGLSNVDNTSDANKPVSTAQQTALNAKAPLASPTFTGTVSGVTAAMVGLGNVNNTSDANKPVSTAQQAALDAKAPLASPALTGTPTAPTAVAGTNTTQVATTAFVKAAINANGPAILVLSAAAPVPGGTPAGTVIIRTAT